MKDLFSDFISACVVFPIITYSIVIRFFICRGRYFPRGGFCVTWWNVFQIILFLKLFMKTNFNKQSTSGSQGTTKEGSPVTQFMKKGIYRWQHSNFNFKVKFLKPFVNITERNWLKAWIVHLSKQYLVLLIIFMIFTISA